MFDRSSRPSSVPTPPRSRPPRPTRPAGPRSRPRPRPRAGDGNRTHVACLEGRYSTIELHPPGPSPVRRRPGVGPSAGGPGAGVVGVGRRSVRSCPGSVSSLGSRSGPLSRRSRSVRPVRPGRAMGGAGFEPAKAVPPDLQSGPFSHLGIHPVPGSKRAGAPAAGSVDDSPASAPTLPRRGRAGGESRTHNRRFTKPVLCRLSYASDRRGREIPNYTVAAVRRKGFFPPASEIGPGSCRTRRAGGGSPRRVRQRTRPRPRRRRAAADGTRSGGSAAPRTGATAIRS